MQPVLENQDRFFFGHWSFAARHFAALSLGHFAARHFASLSFRCAVILLRCHFAALPLSFVLRPSSFVLCPLSFVFRPLSFVLCLSVNCLLLHQRNQTNQTNQGFRLIPHLAFRTPHSHSTLRISFPRFTCILNPHTLHS